VEVEAMMLIGEILSAPTVCPGTFLFLQWPSCRGGAALSSAAPSSGPRGDMVAPPAWAARHQPEVFSRHRLCPVKTRRVRLLL